MHDHDRRTPRIVTIIVSVPIFQSDFNLLPLRGEDCNGVAVCHAYNTALESGGNGKRREGEEKQEEE
jgi:hypothetical protein